MQEPHARTRMRTREETQIRGSILDIDATAHNREFLKRGETARDADRIDR